MLKKATKAFLYFTRNGLEKSNVNALTSIVKEEARMTPESESAIQHVRIIKRIRIMDLIMIKLLN